MGYGKGRKRREGGVCRIGGRHTPTREETERALWSLIRIAADLLERAGETRHARADWLEEHGSFRGTQARE